MDGEGSTSGRGSVDTSRMTSTGLIECVGVRHCGVASSVARHEAASRPPDVTPGMSVRRARYVEIGTAPRRAGLRSPRNGGTARWPAEPDGAAARSGPTSSRCVCTLLYRRKW
jgi:hypothetical protein